MFVYCTNAASFFAYLKYNFLRSRQKCKQKTYTSARIRQRCCYVSVRPTQFTSRYVSAYFFMRLVDQSVECLVWNAVFSFYCAIGKAIWKIACSIAPTGGEEILQAYLAQTKITAFENKRPNVLAKCAVVFAQVSTLRSMHTDQQIVTVCLSMRLGRHLFIKRLVMRCKRLPLLLKRLDLLLYL